MKKTLLVVSILFALALVAAAQPGTVLLNAAGATFPYPIYSKWFDVYHQKNGDVHQLPIHWLRRRNSPASGRHRGLRRL